MKFLDPIDARLVATNAVDEPKLAKIIRLSYGKGDEPSDLERDRATIRNCFNAGHMSVFEFVDATFAVQCPIFVARQIMRYRCASYLERSLRRCEPLPFPSSSIYEYAYGCKVKFYKWIVAMSELYDAAIKADVLREDARACLPLGSTTQFFMKTNLREWYHIFDERLGVAAQKETRWLVQQIKDALAEVFPFYIQLYDSRDRAAPGLGDSN